MSDFFGDLLSLGKRVIAAAESIQEHIDRNLSKNSADGTMTTEAASEATSPVNTSPHGVSSQYQRHIANGCCDPLELLTAADASRLMGCATAPPVTTGEEEYISAHYGCADDRSMYVTLSVSALMPWNFIRDEVSTFPVPQTIGDEALQGGDILYVRVGSRFFWIYGRAVSEAVVTRIAKHVASEMGRNSGPTARND